MSTAHMTCPVELSDRTHTWRDKVHGTTHSSVDFGSFDIIFDSAGEARAVAAKCLAAADALDAINAEGGAA